MMDESNSLGRFQRVILIQGTIILVAFTLILSAALFLFRNQIRQQILSRDGILLTGISQHFYARASHQDTQNALLDVILDSSELKDVIGVRLYSPTGELLASLPAQMTDATLEQDDLSQLSSRDPVITYHPEIQMGSLFSDIDALIDDSTYAVTRVCAPVFSNDRLVAAIEYWLDSREVSAELHHLDQYLVVIGVCFIIGGGIVFFIVFYVARDRLLKMGKLLAEQNLSLQKANADLSMAARTSAIGSISSHLFHGLKNPLAGLKAYLQVAGHDDEVLEITNRMQNLINDSLAVIKEEEDLFKRTLSSTELLGFAKNRLCADTDSTVQLTSNGTGSITAHKAQLLLLVIRNLVDNAVDANGEAPVKVDFEFGETGLAASVTDAGPGLPEHVKDHIFEPVRSTKANGTGIGLAISSVIARHIPAKLVLDRSDSTGTRFIINVPQ